MVEEKVAKAIFNFASRMDKEAGLDAYGQWLARWSIGPLCFSGTNDGTGLNGSIYFFGYTIVSAWRI